MQITPETTIEIYISSITAAYLLTVIIVTKLTGKFYE